MRIAMIGQKGIPGHGGGIERHVEELAAGLARAGHDVIVYTRPWYTSRGRRSCRGARLVSLPSVKTKHLDAISHTLLATFDAIFRRVDVFHYHGVGPALLAWVPRVFAPRARVIVTFHSMDSENDKWNPVAKFILKIAEWCAVAFPHTTIAVSEHTARQIRERFGREAFVIPTGIPTAPSVRATPILRRFGLVRGRYVLAVGRLVPPKATHVLVLAWKILQRTAPRVMRGRTLVVVGGDAFTQRYADKIRLLVKKDRTIKLLGAQNASVVAALMKHAAIFVHPSEREGMPLALLEAVGAGTPALVSDIPAHREIISDPARRFRPNDVSALALDLYRLLRANVSDLRAEAMELRAAARLHYNARTALRRVLAVYNGQTSVQPLVRSKLKTTLALVLEK